MFIFVALGRAVDGHLEAAMRFARNLALGLDVVERFGHRRWGFAQWDAHHTAEVVRLMETQAAVQLPIEWIAAQMALSVRTLERRLAAENVNYRGLQAEVLKGRLKLLLQDPALSLADIAEKLG